MAFDQCMKDSLNMPRPFYGYHSLVKVHQTSRYYAYDIRDLFFPSNCC